jgi:hypothetical protein
MKQRWVFLVVFEKDGGDTTMFLEDEAQRGTRITSFENTDSS